MGLKKRHIEQNWSQIEQDFLPHGKATNRLNELHENNTLVAEEFDKFINAMASWNNCFTVKQSIQLASDLIKLKEKWTNKFKNERNDN